MGLEALSHLFHQKSKPPEPKEGHFVPRTDHEAGPPLAPPMSEVVAQTYSLTSLIKPGEEFITPDGTKHVARSSQEILQDAVNAAHHGPSPLKRST